MIPTPHLRAGLLAALAAAVVALAVAAGLWGIRGIAGAMLGVAMVVGSFLASTYAVVLAEGVSRSLVLPVGLTVYGAKVAFFGGVLVAVKGAGIVDVRGVALTLVVATLAWVVGHASWVYRAKIPYVEVPAG